ncbi:hypothetical protein CC78DRAFT_573415 [Lojkania enalia]|uniref:Uncharacterized protein n=1 Tax=Lojkania enalia TaxID=147567 RepID=A0A9P4ND48_9PLEO|nr:hypothetical protein CC78DRAFT_573415 [Didymosphaeria enalia]
MARQCSARAACLGAAGFPPAAARPGHEEDESTLCLHELWPGSEWPPPSSEFSITHRFSQRLLDPRSSATATDSDSCIGAHHMTTTYTPSITVPMILMHATAKRADGVEAMSCFINNSSTTPLHSSRTISPTIRQPRALASRMRRRLQVSFAAPPASLRLQYLSTGAIAGTSSSVQRQDPLLAKACLDLAHWHRAICPFPSRPCSRDGVLELAYCPVIVACPSPASPVAKPGQVIGNRCNPAKQLD